MTQNSIPSLINGAAGKPVLAEAGKKCTCKGCGSVITMGEKCFDIPNPHTAHSNSRRFCASCFAAVIKRTKADIEKLETL
jgi:hypothetical protein